MKKYRLLEILLITILVSSCNSIEEEYISMLITSSHLELFNDNTFIDKTTSDIIGPDGSSEPLITKGKYERINDGIVLFYERNNFADTLYYVNWGERIFLISKIGIIHLCNEINLGKIDYKDYNGLTWLWTNINTIDGKVDSIPKLPKRYSQYIFQDSIIAKVIDIDMDSLSLQIDKGSDSKLFVGCELMDGDYSYTVKSVQSNISVLQPTRLYWDIFYNKSSGSDTLSLPLKEYKIGMNKLEVGKSLYAKK
jgi:hypothetical protein